MWREVARVKQRLSEEQCLEVLNRARRGVLSVIGDDGYPYGVPINHYYHEADGKIYFHGGMRGHRVDAVQANNKVCFTVYDEGTHFPGEWWLTFKSVIVFGRVEVVENREYVYELSSLLSRKFTDDVSYIDYEIAHSGPGTLMLALTPEHMTGKLVREK